MPNPETKRPTIPDTVWAPLSAAALILFIGLVGLATHQPLLFPSLGPTAFLQTETPDQPSARPYNVVTGHLVGLLAGFLAVWVCGAGDAPSVLSVHQLTAPRVWASVLAILLTLLVGLLLRASHPPAAATTLLASLGGFSPTVQSTVTVMSGVLGVALLGEFLRLVRLRQQTGGSPP
ncbi:HPP family protein [Deinococcus oregonensis]|uniref:HPP family protein n=1 Tax=Deinococcus oregonensis TaxID=1805970 RepID=A0ABV6B630_9DEIO